MFVSACKQRWRDIGSARRTEQNITFSMMWEELCPPLDASRLPGKPAVSQFEQMSISIVLQSTQRNRAPTISCLQLRLHQRKDTETSGENHPLEASDARVREGYRKKRAWVSTTKKRKYACHSHSSPALSYASSPSDLPGQVCAREGGLTLISRKGWIG